MSNRQQIHIGHEIESRINELNISKSEFARRIGTSKQNVNRILEKESIDTAVLIRYGEVLNYNFFNLYADVSNHHTVQAINHSAASVSGDAMVLNDGCPDQEKHLIDKMSMEIEMLKKLLDKTEKQLEEKERFINHLLSAKQ
jgi:transcriptional regulator with XRE-family HTH domain